VRVAGHGDAHNAAKSGNRRRTAERRRTGVQDGVRNFTEGFAGKRRLTGEHFEEESAGREKIGASVNGNAAELFGRSVAGGAEKESWQSDLGESEVAFTGRLHGAEFGDAEVHQLGA